MSGWLTKARKSGYSLQELEDIYNTESGEVIHIYENPTRDEVEAFKAWCNDNIFSSSEDSIEASRKPYRQRIIVGDTWESFVDKLRRATGWEVPEEIEFLSPKEVDDFYITAYDYSTGDEIELDIKVTPTLRKGEVDEYMTFLDMDVTVVGSQRLRKPSVKASQEITKEMNEVFWRDTKFLQFVRNRRFDLYEEFARYNDVDCEAEVVGAHYDPKRDILNLDVEFTVGYEYDGRWVEEIFNEPYLFNIPDNVGWLRNIYSSTSVKASQEVIDMEELLSYHYNQLIDKLMEFQDEHPGRFANGSATFHAEGLNWSSDAYAFELYIDTSYTRFLDSFLITRKDLDGTNMQECKWEIDQMVEGYIDWLDEAKEMWLI